MKNIKKILLLTLPSLLIISCSKDDAPIEGCTDPLALNYNVNATVSNGICQYSFIGDWELYKYTWGSTNVLAGYKYLYQDIYADGSYEAWGQLNDGSDISVLGTYKIGGTNNSVITFTNEFGDVSVFTVTKISATDIKMTAQLTISGTTQTAIIEAKKV